MTNHRTRRAAMPGLLFTWLLLGACAAGPSRSVGSSDPASTPLAAPTAAPTVPIIPSKSAPGEPSGTEPLPAEPSFTEPSFAEPPAATLAVDGGDPVTGQLGSFTWDNSGSDAPWLAGSPLRIGRGEPLTLRFATDVGVTNWTVSRAPAGTDGSNLTGVADRSGEPVTFAAPPRGTWTVNVNVWFAGNLGSGSYYWLVTVD